MRNGTPQQAALVRNAIETGGLEQIDAVMEAVESTGAIQYTAGSAQQAADKAIAALKILPGSEYRDALQTLAEFSVNRSY